MKKLIPWLWLSFLTACTTDSSKDYDGAVFYQMGMQAEQSGDLQSARNYYGKAQSNARSGRLGPAKEAHAAYAWSRISGYLGFYAEAEKGFETTLALIEKSEGDANALRAPALFELARMHHDTENHAKAVPAYARAFAELQRLGVGKIEPLAYAGFLDDYADSLRATGATAPADEMTARSAAIKERAPANAPRIAIRRYKG